MTSRGLTPEQSHAVLEGVQDALFVTDSSGFVVYMNPAAIELFGFDEHFGVGDEGINLQDHLSDGYEMATLGGASVAQDDQPLVRALRGEAYRDMELLVERAEEDPRVYVFSGKRIDGVPPLGVLTVRDETDRWRGERRYRTLFEADPAPSLVARLADLRILQANKGMEELTGLGQDALSDEILTGLEPLYQHDDLRDTIERLQNGESAHKVQKILLRKGEENVHVLVSARALEVEGEACGIFTFVDTTELETAKRQHGEALNQLSTALHERAGLTKLSTTDPLTGLVNRRVLDTRLSEELSRAERYGNTFCVLLLDLDNFKTINDSHGHHMGDLVLLGVAHLLHEECRETDLVGRWGGDEFMMILSQTDVTEAASFAFRIRERVTNENAVWTDRLTLSIGVASFETDDTHDSLFERADRATRAAKDKGRNRVEVAGTDGAGT